MIIKLDMANAFDRVDHSFLRAALKKFGFSSKIVDIISGCISNPWTAPLINGRPSNFFKSSRGLRQGCPLSPFLYIIMVETLSVHLENLRLKREIMGISIERGIKEINHSLFADDTLLIGGASNLMARRFKRVLDAFLLVSGGKLNNRKCKIYTWNVPYQIQQSISQILDIPLQRNWTSFSYLGLPLAKEHIKAEVWTKHIDKMRSLLQSWGVSWLNLAGRTILIKVVLSGLPIYQYAVIMAPASIHKHMELIMRSFLWQGGKQDTKKFSLVNWGQVTLPYEKGGLSIKIPSLSNQALGLKLIWKIISSKGSWWVETIKRKYFSGPNSNILNDPIIDRPCTPVWRLIKKVLPHFRENVSKLPGNGKDTKIWADRIMNSNPRNLLQELRPLQDWMEDRRLITLYDISSWNQNRWRDWKELQLPQDLKESWYNLKSSLSGKAPVNKEKEDTYIWIHVEGHSQLEKGKILTAENLRKRGIQGPSICCFCKAEEESIQHSFLLCPLDQNCWNQLSSPLEVRGNYEQVHTLQKTWKKDFPHQRKGKNNIIRVWKCIPATLCWNLWLARNNYVFNNIQPRPGTIIAKTIANISEAVSANLITTPDQTSWAQEEKDWYNKFNICHTQNPPPKSKAHQKQSIWKLRGTKEEILQWIRAQNRPTLFFDGASKNNPGAAGAGGIIKDQNGVPICRYEWGLGKASNNAAEAYSLLLGSTILSKKGLKNAIILGDSAIIISSMNTGKKFIKEGLNNTRARIIDNLRDMGEISFMHVLRDHNVEADFLANEAVKRKQGQVREDDRTYDRAIP
eukprot:PITA_07860